MKKLLIPGLLALAMPAPALARPTLSTPTAKHAIKRYAQQDRARSYRIDRCNRISRRSVSCRVTEYGIRTAISDNGQPIVGDLTYRATATRTKHRVVVRSLLFAS